MPIIPITIVFLILSLIVALVIPANSSDRGYIRIQGTVQNRNSVSIAPTLSKNIGINLNISGENGAKVVIRSQKPRKELTKKLDTGQHHLELDINKASLNKDSGLEVDIIEP